MAEPRLFFDNPMPVPTSVVVTGLEMYYRHPVFGSYLRLHLLTDTGNPETVDVHEGAEAIIEALNTADMRTNTLLHRILTWLSQNHPQYAGTVAS